MIMKVNRLFAAIILSGIWAASVRAQGIRLFVEGTGSFLKDERFFTICFAQAACGPSIGPPTLGRFRSAYASGGKVILGGEYSLAKVLGVEGAYGYGHNNLRMANLDTSQTLGYSVAAQRLSANLVAHSPTPLLGVRPYVTAGLEYDHLGPTSQAKSIAFTEGFAGQLVHLGANNKLGLNYGGGVDWGFLPTLALRIDLRDHLTGSPTYGLSGRIYPISGAAHDVELSVGLVFHVGK
jgi:hypothetical protein